MRTIPTLASLAFLLLTLGCASQGSAPSQPPRSQLPHTNVIVILADDAGYADFGFTGSTELRTPHLDALARDGVRFTQAYVTASVCCPSRAGLLTGRYQQRFGHEFNGPGQPEAPWLPSDMGLSLEEETLGEVFRALGHRTACVGKWHMGTQAQFHPNARGFDEFFGLLGGSRSYRSIAGEGQKRPPLARRMQRDGEEVPETAITYLTDDLTDAAIDFVARCGAATPFCLYLSYTAVHTPMHAKPADTEEFAALNSQRRRTYAAMMKALDDGVGRLRAQLEAAGVADDTLIIFLNDNGGATDNGSDNGLYRGMKGSKWEGGVRVPFCMTWPAGLRGGGTYDAPVSTLDVLPTTVAAASGAAAQTKHSLDGVNLLPFVRGERDDAPHAQLFWRRGIAAACRDGDWKLIRVEGQAPMLFDLATDPSERHDVAASHADVTTRLATALAHWESELAPPRWREGPRWEANQRRKHDPSTLGREAERRFP